MPFSTSLAAISPLFCSSLHDPPKIKTPRRPLASATPDSIASTPTRRRTTTAMACAAAGDVPTRGAASSETPVAALAVEAGPFLAAAAAEEVSTRSSNPRSLEATLNGLSKWMVAAVFGVIVVWRRDAEVVWLAIGSVLNACLSITLKRIINHQRPDPNLKSGPGMPSSHAQSIFYVSVILVLFTFRWLLVNAVSISIGAFALASSIYFSWLRVSQQYHTNTQVLVGAIIGSVFAATWFWSWHAFVLNAFIRSIWVRMIVVLSAVSFCIGFLLYVIRHWLKYDSRSTMLPGIRVPTVIL